MHGDEPVAENVPGTHGVGAVVVVVVLVEVLVLVDVVVLVGVGPGVGQQPAATVTKITAVTATIRRQPLLVRMSAIPPPGLPAQVATKSTQPGGDPSRPG